MNEFTPRRMGVPLTDEERTRRHYQLYGTTQLPPRGTGLARQQKLEGEFSWGTLFAGVVIGGILGYFVFTETGRKIGYRAGERVARRI